VRSQKEQCRTILCAQEANDHSLGLEWIAAVNLSLHCQNNHMEMAWSFWQWYDNSKQKVKHFAHHTHLNLKGHLWFLNISLWYMPAEDRQTLEVEILWFKWASKINIPYKELGQRRVCDVHCKKELYRNLVYTSTEVCLLCREPSFSLHSYTLPLVQWSTRLLPVMRDSGNLGFSC
jgi:hypothetical protein